MAGHHHHHAGCGCGHEHDPEVERGLEYSLYKYIDIDHVRCLNESTKGSGKSVFKPYDQRLDKTKFVESDDDEQLILYIPFTGHIKLKSVCVIGGTHGKSPSKMKAFINREDIDFSNVDDIQPVQEWDLQEDPRGEYEWPTRITKFQNVSSLTLFFPENHGADTTVMYYVGLKGDFTPAKRQAVTATYELKPLPATFQNPAESGVARQIE